MHKNSFINYTHAYLIESKDSSSKSHFCSRNDIVLDDVTNVN